MFAKIQVLASQHWLVELANIDRLVARGGSGIGLPLTTEQQHNRVLEIKARQLLEDNALLKNLMSIQF